MPTTLIRNHTRPLLSQTSARRMLDLPQMVRLIGCSSPLSLGQGHEQLIEAVSALPENVHLLLSGQGEATAYLHDLAKQRGLYHRLHHIPLGPQPSAIFFRALHVYYQPECRSADALSGLEQAQQQAIPIVRSAQGQQGEHPSVHAYSLLCSLSEALDIPLLRCH